MMRDADDLNKIYGSRYPNMVMCAAGATSGRWSEWPRLRSEIKQALTDLEAAETTARALMKELNFEHTRWFSANLITIAVVAVTFILIGMGLGHVLFR